MIKEKREKADLKSLQNIISNRKVRSNLSDAERKK
jgi:hypothetical protein